MITKKTSLEGSFLVKAGFLANLLWAEAKFCYVKVADPRTVKYFNLRGPNYFTLSSISESQ